MKKEKEKRFVSPEYRVKKDADGRNIIEGYAAVFNSWSEDLGGFREKIAPGAFTEALKRSDARALYNHDFNHVLGRQGAGTLKLSEDDHGLFMAVELPDTQLARDLTVLIERGDVHQQSFGFTVKKDQWEENRETGEVSRTLVEIDQLYDVSPVTFPAYPDTTVAKRSLETWKKDAENSASHNGNDPIENQADENIPSSDEIFIRLERILKK